MTAHPLFVRRAGGLSAVLLALLVVAPRHAEAQEGGSAEPAFDLTGAWILNVSSPNGEGTRDVTFVQEGDSITGEISSSMAEGSLEGTIEGNAVTFVAAILMDSGVFEVTYRANWVDGELKEGTVDFGSYGSGTFTGHRKETGGEG